MKKIFYRLRSFVICFFGHKWVYYWGVSGVDRHGLLCKRCKMQKVGIPGRRLHRYKYEIDKTIEIDGAK